MPAEPKIQMNVYLLPNLVRRVKHRAIDAGLSLSSLVQAALEGYLDRTENQEES